MNIELDTEIDTKLPIDEAQCWQAVQSRDASFDGVFYYGVRSTKVFCRPSCPSRQPRRDRVVFFAIPEAAKQSGFRPCLRCSPDEVRLRNPQADLTHRICRAIESELDNPIKLSVLGERMNLSPSYLQRVFKNALGITPRQYAEAIRVQRFKSRVRSGHGVVDAIYDAGYGSSSRLYEKADIQLGMTPATYRRGGKGMKIRYTIVPCSLGRLLVAATDRGICSVTLGDTDESILKNLEAEFPQARFHRDQAGLSQWVKALLDHLEGQRPSLDLPLDVQATAFQKLVWEELRRIPYGETASYSEIARRIGKPSATRAVARACATNPVALITPCHRVVRENGDPGGYRWGIERKKALLSREQN